MKTFSLQYSPPDAGVPTVNEPGVEECLSMFPVGFVLRPKTVGPETCPELQPDKAAQTAAGPVETRGTGRPSSAQHTEIPCAADGRQKASAADLQV